MLFRRIIPSALIVALIGAICPAPALALSTQTEVEMGRAYDQQIVESSVIENDPLLNAWVNDVTGKLWKQTARKDVPYNVKIIKTNDINAFSTLGGYVYVNTGLLDFVQSDDELAAVLGHETGHIERRHVVTMQSKAQILNLLFGVASLFSPFIYRFGNIIQAGAIAKMQRIDELQADQYGLLMMSRAGYDPYAMVTMQKHLGALENEHSDLVTKYLEDHPGSDARVSHLMGYPQLDPTVVTAQQRLVQALHNLDQARYSVAAYELNDIVKTSPGEEEALLGLGQAQLALGLTAKSEQTLGEALQKASPAVQQVARMRIAALRSMEAKRVTLTQPNIESLRSRLQSAEATQNQAVAEIGSRHDEGHSQLSALKNRLDAISYEIPDFSRVEIKRGSRLEAVQKNLNGMARSVNAALEDAGTAINGVGQVDPKTNKPNGQLRENGDILTEMQAPLSMAPTPSSSVAIFPSYPRMLSEIEESDGDMVRAVDAGRGAAMQLDQGLGDLDAFLKRLQQVGLNAFGDINQYDYDALVPYMQKATASLGQSATSASEAAQLFQMAKSRQLVARITLLGLGTSPQRYATLQKALDVRFKTDGVDYNTMLRHNLTPGEIAAATILAADKQSTPEDIVDQLENGKHDVVDLANSKGMSAQALEIFTGLIYLDYTDDPVKEALPQP
ncbi:MAG: M48 family metalloprotease [Candidatus Eremiobacteraeota bacterium]|nr:M48 family metalloprotease [Candidatus Eremiobacteraeota bacterium]